ncbi:YndJ family protein [Streptomyces sp. NPDC127084]|uniref:YndJ family protein n=1 Tax=Streptomyces sp. NPDC127084 TaxID=3347133 RepID=UPI00366A3217
MTALVNAIVMLGMLLIIPMGLRLIDDPVPQRLARLWPWLSIPGAVALWLPRGTLSTALASVYAIGTMALALGAPARLRRTRSLAPAEIATLTALASPAVAGVALVAERSGHRLFGFELEMLALTVPHFHFAGFTAALVAGLVCRAVTHAPLSRFAALSVPFGTLLVLAGYFVNDETELAGALVLTAGMWAVALLTWREIRPGSGRLNRALLGVSAASLAATMVLALCWAVGEVTGLPHPSLTWMAATHGIGNALGFGLCSVLAWQRLGRTPGAGRGAPAPVHDARETHDARDTHRAGTV